ncbi:MAG TPA: phosphatase PAP2 family protein [Methylomirabilota bacterium]|jgi:membrane-associated phospholipid phosphatase
MEATTVARWRALCLVLLGAFLGLSLVVYTVGLLPGDAPLHQEILKSRGTVLHAAARWADYGGKWMFLAPAMLLLLAWSRAARRHWWLWCALMPVGGAVEQSFKFLVGRPRPRGVNWGFPSGHVTAAATFTVILVYVLSRERVSSAARATFVGLGVVLVGAVGFARVILNAHWPTDVLGGILLGAGCAAAGAWWDARHPAGAEPARPRAVSDAVRIGG